MKKFVLAAVLALAFAAPAQANDHAAAAPAAAEAAKAAAPATEKCEVTKDGVTSTSDVAVGECAKAGGKVVEAKKEEAAKEAAPAAK